MGVKIDVKHSTVIIMECK